MGEVRVVVPKGASPLRSVASHVRDLQEQGRDVLLLTADRPYAALVLALRKEGADPDRIFFVDTVSSLDGAAPAERPRNALFLQSPTMLEMMAMRLEQSAQRLGPAAHVVVDSLTTLALYNGPVPVQEFSHYLANRLRSVGVPGDFIVQDTQDGRALHDRVASFTDVRIEIHARGAP